MFFWLAVLVGSMLAILALKIGFYEMVSVFINVLASVYLAIFVTPVLVSIIPAATDIPFGGVIMVLVVAIGTFLILHGLCFALLTGQFKVSFPKMLDLVLAGGLGFLTGFLVIAFVTTLLAITPLSQIVTRISENDLKVHQSYVGWWCDRVHALVGSTASPHPTQDCLDQLRRIESRQPSHESPTRPEPNAPVGMSAPLRSRWIFRPAVRL